MGTPTLKPVRCDYCGLPAELVDGATMYPSRPDLAGKSVYRCSPCGAWVGTHPGTTTPLGRLANAELRRWKANAHAVFDRLWRPGTMTRSQAYAWLAQRLAIEPAACHIGMFDVDQCRRVVEVCRARELMEESDNGR